MVEYGEGMGQGQAGKSSAAEDMSSYMRIDWQVGGEGISEQEH